MRHISQKIHHGWVDLSLSCNHALSMHATGSTFLCKDIRRDSATPRRVVLVCTFKEAILRSPRTQLKKVQIEKRLRERHTEGTSIILHNPSHVYVIILFSNSNHFSGHLVPSPIVGLACAPIVETKFLELAMSLLDFSPRIPLGTFSILL